MQYSNVQLNEYGLQENKWDNYFFSNKTNNKVAMEKIEDILVHSNPYVSLNTATFYG